MHNTYLLGTHTLRTTHLQYIDVLYRLTAVSVASIATIDRSQSVQHEGICPEQNNYHIKQLLDTHVQPPST